MRRRAEVGEVWMILTETGTSVIGEFAGIEEGRAVFSPGLGLPLVRVPVTKVARARRLL